MYLIKENLKHATDCFYIISNKSNKTITYIVINISKQTKNE